VQDMESDDIEGKDEIEEENIEENDKELQLSLNIRRIDFDSKDL